MSRAKLRIRLKWPNVYPCFCMVLHDIVVFLFFFCLLRYCMIFCCMYCLLRTFLNCHSVCHQNNKYVCTPFNNNAVVVTMDHWSSWRTHKLIAWSYWIISCWLKRIDHAVWTNVTFITLYVGRCNFLIMWNNTTINPPYNVMTNLSLGRSMLKLHCILCVFV